MFSKEIKLFIGLLSVLALLIAYRIATKEEPGKVTELTYKPGGRKEQPGVKNTGKGVELSMADKGKKSYSGVIRNPFKPLFPPSPPPRAILPKIAVPPPSPSPAITATGPSPVQTEAGKVKFLGLFQKDGERKIFLSREKEVYIVKKGDSVGLFHVGDVTENTVILVAKDTQEEFRIVIEDVKSTNPGILPGGGRR